MFVKKIKRKCDVRGCKNVKDVFLISKRREMSNTVAMCKDCLEEALKAIAGYKEPVKIKKEVKSLFPHPELEVTQASVADTKEPKPKEVIGKAAEDISIQVTEETVVAETKSKTKSKAKR